MNIYTNIIATESNSIKVDFVRHFGRNEAKLPSGYEDFCRNIEDRDFGLVVASAPGVKVYMTTDAHYDADRRFANSCWHNDIDDYDTEWEDALKWSYACIKDLQYDPNEGQFIKGAYWKTTVFVNGYATDPKTVIPECQTRFTWVKEGNRYMGSVRQIVNEATALLELVQKTAEDSFSCSCSICPHKTQR